MVSFKTKVYPFCVMVFADEGNNVKCNIARFDYSPNDDEYLSLDEAISEAESLIEKYKDKWVKKYERFGEL